MKNLFLYFFLLTAIFSVNCKAQENGQADSIEVFLIDSFITPEVPHKFLLSFYTSDSCKSKVILAGKYKYDISKEFVSEHKTEIDVSKLKFDSSDVYFYIYVTGADGKTYSSERYEVALPVEDQQQVSGSHSNVILMCCLGGTIFGLPSPTYVSMNNKSYFGLTKEIPIISFVTNNYKYPLGYFSAEYAYIFQAPEKNFARLGYKQIIEIPYIEFISPGLNGFTNFKGFNGISPELSLGLFNVYDVFTVIAKYRYNFKPDEAGRNFHELSIGLYSGFFTFHINL